MPLQIELGPAVNPGFLARSVKRNFWIPNHEEPAIEGTLGANVVGRSVEIVMSLPGHRPLFIEAVDKGSSAIANLEVVLGGSAGSMVLKAAEGSVLAPIMAEYLIDEKESSGGRY